MIQHKNKHYISLISGVLSLVFGIAPAVHADIGKAVSLGVNSGCVSTVNTQSGTSRTTVAYGSMVSLPVSNDDNVVSQSVGGPGIPGGTVLQPNAKSSTYTHDTFSIGPVTSAITITFTPIPSNDPGTVFDNNCPTGSTPHASALVVNPTAPPAPTPTPTPAATTTPSTTAASQTEAKTATPTTTASNPTTTSPAANNVKPLQIANQAKPATKNSNSLMWSMLALLLVVVVAWFVWQHKLFGLRSTFTSSSKKK